MLKPRTESASRDRAQTRSGIDVPFDSVFSRGDGICRCISRFSFSDVIKKEDSRISR